MLLKSKLHQCHQAGAPWCPVCLASKVCVLSRTAVVSSSPSHSPSQSSFYHSIPAPPALLITCWYLPQNSLSSLACHSVCVYGSDKMDLLYVCVSKKCTAVHAHVCRDHVCVKEFAMSFARPNLDPVRPAHCTDWPVAAGRTWVSSWSVRGGQSHTPWPERPAPPSGQGPGVTTSPWSSWWGQRHTTPHQTRPPVRLLTRWRTGLSSNQTRKLSGL